MFPLTSPRRIVPLALLVAIVVALVGTIAISRTTHADIVSGEYSMELSGGAASGVITVDEGIFFSDAGPYQAVQWSVDYPETLGSVTGITGACPSGTLPAQNDDGNRVLVGCISFSGDVITTSAIAFSFQFTCNAVGGTADFVLVGTSGSSPDTFVAKTTGNQPIHTHDFSSSCPSSATATNTAAPPTSTATATNTSVPTATDTALPPTNTPTPTATPTRTVTPAATSTAAKYNLSAHAVLDGAGAVTLTNTVSDLGGGNFQAVQWSTDYDQSLVRFVSFAPNCTTNVPADSDDGSRVLTGCISFGGDTIAASAVAYVATFVCIAPGTATFTLTGAGTDTFVAKTTGNPPVSLAEPSSVECPANTPTATRTSTATNTPTPSSTSAVANTPTVTNTPTPTSTAAQYHLTADAVLASGTVTLTNAVTDLGGGDFKSVKWSTDYDSSLVQFVSFSPGCGSNYPGQTDDGSRVLVGCISSAGDTIAANTVGFTVTFACIGTGTAVFELTGVNVDTAVAKTTGNVPISVSEPSSVDCAASTPTVTSTPTPTAPAAPYHLAADATVDGAGTVTLTNTVTDLGGGSFQAVEWNTDYDQSLVQLVSFTAGCGANIPAENDDGSRILTGCVSFGGDTIAANTVTYTATFACIGTGTATFGLTNLNVDSFVAKTTGNVPVTVSPPSSVECAADTPTATSTWTATITPTQTSTPTATATTPPYHLTADAVVDGAGTVTLTNTVTDLGGGSFQAVQWSTDYDQSLVQLVSFAAGCGANASAEGDDGSRVLTGCISFAGDTIAANTVAYTATFLCTGTGTATFKLIGVGSDTSVQKSTGYAPVTVSDPSSVECAGAAPPQYNLTADAVNNGGTITLTNTVTDLGGGNFAAVQWSTDYDQSLVQFMSFTGGCGSAIGAQDDDGSRLLTGCISFAGDSITANTVTYGATFVCLGTGTATFTLTGVRSDTFVLKATGSNLPVSVSEPSSVDCAGAAPTWTATTTPTATRTATATPTATSTGTPNTPTPTSTAAQYNLTADAVNNAGTITLTNTVTDLGGGNFQAVQWNTDYDPSLVQFKSFTGGCGSALAAQNDDGSRLLTGCISLAGNTIAADTVTYSATFVCIGAGTATFTLTGIGADTLVAKTTGNVPISVSEPSSVECAGTPTATSTPTRTATVTATPAPAQYNLAANAVNDGGTVTLTNTVTDVGGGNFQAVQWSTDYDESLVQLVSFTAGCGVNPSAEADDGSRVLTGCISFAGDTIAANTVTYTASFVCIGTGMATFTLIGVDSGDTSVQKTTGYAPVSVSEPSAVECAANTRTATSTATPTTPGTATRTPTETRTPTMTNTPTITPTATSAAPQYRLTADAALNSGTITLTNTVTDLGGGNFQVVQWNTDYDESLVQFVSFTPACSTSLPGNDDDGSRVLTGCISLSGNTIAPASAAFTATFACIGTGTATFTLTRIDADTLVSKSTGNVPIAVSAPSSVECDLGGRTATATSTRTVTSTPTATSTATQYNLTADAVNNAGTITLTNAVTDLGGGNFRGVGWSTDYDESLVRFQSFIPGCGSNFWNDADTGSSVVTACESFTGDTIAADTVTYTATFVCIGTGRAVFELTGPNLNSFVAKTTGNVPITVSEPSSVECGSTPTATATDTPTSTPTSTSTPTVVPTATNTPTPRACLPKGQWQAQVLGVVRRFGSVEGDPRYDPKYDLNHDGKIRLEDLLIAVFTPVCRKK